MKIKKGFVLRNMGDQYVVVAIGEASKTFKGMIRMNETGQFLWECIENGAEREELIEKLLEKYDVDKAKAQDDVNKFVDSLLEAGCIG